VTTDLNGNDTAASLEKRVRSLERRVQVGSYAMVVLGAVLVIALRNSGREGDSDRGDPASAHPGADARTASEAPLGALEGTSLTLRTAEGRVWLTATPLETGGELYLRSTGKQPFHAPPGIHLRAEFDAQYAAFSGGGDPFPPIWVGIQEDRPGILLSRPDGEQVVAIGLHPDGHGVVLLGSGRPDERPVWYAPPDARLEKLIDDGTKDD